MKKAIIVKISAIILFILTLVILFLGNYYKSVYSSCKADSVTIAKNINTVIANSDVSVTSELKGYIVDDKLCIISVDGKKCNIELTSMANFSDIKYWTAKLEGNKVTQIWTADKDILKESKLKEYKYGDQKNIFTLLSKNYIGYYDMNTAI